MNGDYYYYCTYNETKIITCPSALNFQCTIVLLQLWTIQRSKFKFEYGCGAWWEQGENV